jgi:hypothetical protein
VTKRRIITGVVVVIATALLLWVWSPAPGLQGKLMARIDLARGHYKVLGYGYGSPARPEFARLLGERYGIEYDEIGGEIVSRHTVAYADGYNSVSAAAVNRRFGRDVFKEAEEEAQKHWEEKAR